MVVLLFLVVVFLVGCFSVIWWIDRWIFVGSMCLVVFLVSLLSSLW